MGYLKLNKTGLVHSKGYTKESCDDGVTDSEIESNSDNRPPRPMVYCNKNDRRMNQIRLDQPPLEMEYVNFQNYKGMYDDYTDVNTGQIEYYYRNDDDDILFTHGKTTYKEYVDPMGTSKPVYTRTSTFESCGCNGQRPIVGCRFTIDALAHREDLLALQLRKMNSSKFKIFEAVEKSL